MQNGDKLSQGHEGERAASLFLETQGFSIIQSNVHEPRRGEIDLIARKGNLLVFVEVKTRTGVAYGGGIFSISSSKRKSLKRTAQWYMAQHDLCEVDTFRFDLICVTETGVEWIKDILR